MIHDSKLRSIISLALVICSAASALGQAPDSLAFVFDEEEVQYWPGESITVSAWWSAAAETLTCFFRNIDSGDTLTISLFPDSDDTSLATGILEFGFGWRLSSTPVADDVLQCSYGNRLIVEALELADSTRIPVEPANLTLISPESLSVGSSCILTWYDRDANLNYDEVDTVTAGIFSFLAGDSLVLTLLETGDHSGAFRDTIPFAYAAAVAPQDDALLLLDADSLLISGVDHLAQAAAWDSIVESAVLDTVFEARTRGGSADLIHTVFGSLTLFPLSGDSIICEVRDRDMTGASVVDVVGAVFDADGLIRDSTSIALIEETPGLFMAKIVVAESGGTLDATAGDTLRITYMDRADQDGVPSIVFTAAALGARVVQGEVGDQHWDAELPILLVDTTYVSAGRSLRIDPGCYITSIPNNAIVVEIDGSVVLGEAASNESVTVVSGAKLIEPAQWEGFVVRGSMEAANLSVSGARYGIRGEEGATITLNKCRLFDNGDPTTVPGEPGGSFRSSRENMNAYLRDGDRFWPGALSGADASMTLIQCEVRRSSGYGISCRGGTLTMTNSLVTGSLSDGILIVESEGVLEEVAVHANDAGGIYGYDASVVLSACDLRDNNLEGCYTTGGSVEIYDCKVTENRSGGIFCGDGAQCMVVRTLIARNHLFGIRGIWEAMLDIESSALVGNGGDALIADYGCSLFVEGTNLGYNRIYGVHVGPWCLVDSLYAQWCWWGEYPPAADSTGTNLDAVWDGHDAPGRAVVVFDPAGSFPPTGPAPTDIMPDAVDELRFESNYAEPGDTVVLRLRLLEEPLDQSFAAVELFSNVDTLVAALCENKEPGFLTGRFFLTDEPDASAPDRIAVLFGDLLYARLVADSTISTSTLDSGPIFDSKPRELELTAVPNPWSNCLNLAWRVPESGQLSLYDISGRVIFHRSVDGGAGTMLLREHDIPGINSGAYLLVLHAGRLSETRPVIRIE